MARLDRSRYGSKEVDRVIRDRLDERRVAGGPERLLLLTFHEENGCIQVSLEDEQMHRTSYGSGDFLALRFKEHPDYELRTNATQEDALMALVDAGKLPEDTDKWGGLTIPWASRTNINPKNRKPVVRIYPVDPELFDTAMEQAKDESDTSSRGRRTRRR